MRRLDDLLAAFCRLVLVDERGSGMSDPVPLSDLPTLEQRVDDVLAVLDAVGAERVTLFGMADGAPLAMLMAATHPARVERLILYCATARSTPDGDDYALGAPAEVLDGVAADIARRWGSGAFLDLMGPSEADGAFRERWARYERAAATPGQVEALLRKGFASDVRQVLPSIGVPTLVLHRRNAVTPSAMGRYIADRIPSARFVELEGRDYLPFLGDYHAIGDEIEEFVTGERSGGAADRALATVLFTDIVESTARASELGDRRWRDLLDEHDDLMRRQLVRFRGREVKTTGDGVLATFDGPARAMRCAAAMRNGATRLGLRIRVGIHTGEVDLRGDDVGGIAVVIAARVVAHAGPGEILVSSAVPPLVVGSGITFVDRGERELKGIPGTWGLFAVEHD
jgi:class 3 adenylate cyclase/pimeloyl-ACP methyl ester carboxylesterase